MKSSFNHRSMKKRKNILSNSPFYSTFQLNQQSHTKGATTQDYSFLKEVSPIYVTSLTGNHVSGTTTLTTGTVSSIGANCISSSNHQQGHQTQSTATVQQNNNLQSLTTVTPPVTVVSGQQVLVHQPPSLVNRQPQPYTNHTTGGWLLGESAQGTIISNNVHPFQNLNNINNNINNSNNNNCGAGIGAAATSVDSNLAKYYGSTTTTGNIELLANGGPRREVTKILYFFLYILFAIFTIYAR